mmetsp:Transcript_103806/g.247131  ORF Transcript_103806/g.247131 Transcript_103806/m.247131 type:complete len:270 (+) Transcript_103806:1218-2027(+)
MHDVQQRNQHARREPCDRVSRCGAFKAEGLARRQRPEGGGGGEEDEDPGGQVGDQGPPDLQPVAQVAGLVEVHNVRLQRPVVEVGVICMGDLQKAPQHVVGLLLVILAGIVEVLPPLQGELRPHPGHGRHRPRAADVLPLFHPAVLPVVREPGRPSAPEDAEEGAPHGDAHAEARLDGLPEAVGVAVGGPRDLRAHAQHGGDQQEGAVGLQEVEIARNLGAVVPEHQVDVAAAALHHVVIPEALGPPRVHEAPGEVALGHAAVQMQQPA